MFRFPVYPGQAGFRPKMRREHPEAGFIFPALGRDLQLIPIPSQYLDPSPGRPGRLAMARVRAI